MKDLIVLLIHLWRCQGKSGPVIFSIAQNIVQTSTTPNPTDARKMPTVVKVGILIGGKTAPAIHPPMHTSIKTNMMASRPVTQHQRRQTLTVNTISQFAAIELSLSLPKI
jgi:hypothetical protein